MNSFGTFACAALLAGGLAAPAFAASSDTTPAPAATDQAANPANAHIAQKLRADLDKAGFSDVRIMPSSFLVRAKDSSGNPVMMVINPDSITEVTDDAMRAKSASNANHAATTPNSTTTTTPDKAKP